MFEKKRDENNMPDPGGGGVIIPPEDESTRGDDPVEQPSEEQPPEEPRGYFGVGTDPADIATALSKLGVFDIVQLDNDAWILVTKQGNTVTVTCTLCGASRQFSSLELDPYNPICEHMGFSYAPLGTKYPGNPTGYPGH